MGLQCKSLAAKTKWGVVSDHTLQVLKYKWEVESSPIEFVGIVVSKRAR
jgi:hypothetical protein